MSSPTPDAALFRGLPDLASEAFGGRALWCSDDFFASMNNLVAAHAPVWDADRYTDRGKWMDGWEPRRRRAPGHDTVIVALGAPGTLAAADIDTRHFLGNAPPFASLEAVAAPPGATLAYLRENAEWEPVLDEVSLERGAHNAFALRPMVGVTHVRLHIAFPAGGVARLRIYGQPSPAPAAGPVDLASAARGARALACSDSFFSRMDNLLMPGPPATMGEGWETKRSPVPRQDWVILALSEPGALDEIIVDTAHFKGNYPTGARLEGLCWPGAPASLLLTSGDWAPLGPDLRLGPDAKHALDVRGSGVVTHVRLTTLSDGGVARLRAIGHPCPPPIDDARLSWLNGLSGEAAEAALLRCCGSRRWAQAMVAARPFCSAAHLQGEALRLWWRLDDADWREAFTHHPAIGASLEGLRARFGATADWSEGEQAGVAQADGETLSALAVGNAAYADRFGFIFIVCASGLSAKAMLGHLRTRIDNLPEDELRVAAGEQAKITALRLNKLEPQ